MTTPAGDSNPSETIKVGGAMVNVSELQNSAKAIESARQNPEKGVRWCKFDGTCTRTDCYFAHHKPSAGAAATTVAPAPAIAPGAVYDASIYIDLDQFGHPRFSVDDVTVLLMGVMARLVQVSLARHASRIRLASFSVPSTLQKGNGKMLAELNKLQVATRVVSDRKKEETDRQLEHEAMHDANNALVLVSSDQDFIFCAAELRRKGKHVTVVHGAPRGSPCAKKLALHVNAAWSYDEFLHVNRSDQVNVGGAMVNVSELHNSTKAIKFARQNPENGVQWCKFDGSCTRRDCPFAHSKKMAAAIAVFKMGLEQHKIELEEKSHVLQILQDPLLRLQSQLTQLFDLAKTHARSSASASGLTFVENCCLAEPGGVVSKFLRATPTGLPNLAAGRLDPFVWVFHGCPTLEGTRDIMRNGFATHRRSGQMYGTGEYFAPEIDVPLQYTRNTGAVLLVILRPDEVKKENNKQYYVVENPTTSDGGTFCLPVLALCRKGALLPPCALTHRPLPASAAPSETVKVGGMMTKVSELQNSAKAIEYARQNPEKGVRWCKFDGNCTRTDCYFAHHKPSAVAAANPSETVKVGGMMTKVAELQNSTKAIEYARQNPEKGVRWCKFDGTCTRTDCYFAHHKPSAGVAAPAPAPASSIEFKDDTDAWVPYSDAAAVQLLLSAKKVGTTEVLATIGKWTYRIDLAQMTQTNKSTGKERDIRFL